VHKRTVVACVLTPGQGGSPQKVVLTFGTMTADVLELADWLAATGWTHVAMESNGVPWKLIWNVLEEQFALLLVNARHVKVVLARKTDANDYEWLADLLPHGCTMGCRVAAWSPPETSMSSVS
jgi:transposase